MVVKLIDSLRSKAILTNKNVLDLRWFISNKYPDMDPKQAAKIFADSINKIIDKNLPMIKEVYRPKIKSLLFEGAVKKPTFEITCADVFKICVKVKVDNDEYIGELAKWTGYMTGKAISSERLKYITNQAHSLINEYPFKNIDEVFEILQEKSKNINPFATGEFKIPSMSNFDSNQGVDGISETFSKSNAFSLSQQNTAEDTFSNETYSENQSITNNSSAYSENFSADSFSSKDFPNTGNYENRKQSDFTHVDYNEYKPIYSFEKSSVSFYDENDKNVKKKFSTFIKKVTMRKFLTVSVTAATAYMFAKSAMVSPDAADTLTSKNTLDGYEPLTNVNTSSTNLIVENMSVAVESQTTPQFSKASGTVDKIYMEEEAPAPIVVETPVMQETVNKTSSNDYIANSTQTLNMSSTAYDLSPESCGKSPGDAGYGITASGTTATAGRTVAVDPSQIPLGTELYIVFPSAWSHLNGIYVAEDTGGAIGNNRIDIFMGENSYDTCIQYGVHDVTVYVQP
jgi:3D (Asp-Asp-Asp) domain-containing protein